MSMSRNVVSLSEFRQQRISIETNATTSTAPMFVSRAAAVSGEGFLALEQLYPNSQPSDPIAIAALGLLADASAALGEAVDSSGAGDRVVSDDCLQAAHGALREAFCLRSLGDGYGATVNALQLSIVNLPGPAQAQQLQVLRRVVEALRKNPWLEFTAAVELVEQLEHVGLVTTPVGFQALADWLSGVQE